MRILVIHNRYREKGGEDSVVDNESAMLERGGHSVEKVFFDNNNIEGVISRIRAARDIFYSSRSERRVQEVIELFKPDVVHVHNFIAALSPSVFFAAKAKNVPVVMTLHNYRLTCPSGVLFRNGLPCEECLNAGCVLPGVWHGCYRESRVGTAALGGSIALHSALGTWKNRVDCYIALTQFAAKKLGGHRVPLEKIRIKPNFVSDVVPGNGGGKYILYVGRLSPEKGINTIIEADRNGLLPMPLWIAGDGPLASEVRNAAERPKSKILLLGSKGKDEVQELMRRAEVLVLPSIWYEGFPMVCAEAMALGLPIVSSRIGGLPEIIRDGVNGSSFEAGNSEEMASELAKYVNGTYDLTLMRENARQEYLDKYSELANYKALISIYSEVVGKIQGGLFNDFHENLLP